MEVKRTRLTNGLDWRCTDRISHTPLPAPAEDVYVLIAGTCVYVTLHGKRDFAGIIKDLEMGGSPGRARWRGSQRSGGGHGSRSRHRDQAEEAKPLALKMEERESPQAKECGQPRAAARGKDTEPSPKGPQPCRRPVSAR